MGLETATYISDLVVTNPSGTDSRRQGDDHIRLLKSSIQATFPNISGAMTADHTELNKLDGVVAGVATANKALVLGATKNIDEMAIGSLSIGGTAITATGAEINGLDGFTGSYLDLNYAKDLRATGVTATEFNTALDGITASAADLNKIDGITNGVALANKALVLGSTKNIDTIDITQNGLKIGGVAVTATAAELNKMDGVTATTAELNILDGVTATAAELNKLDGCVLTTTELNYLDNVTSNVQTQLNAKQATITGGATTIVSSNLTANRALISNGSGKVAVSAVTSTELGYLDGVTSSVQTQLDSRLARSWTAKTGVVSLVGLSVYGIYSLDTSRDINMLLKDAYSNNDDVSIWVSTDNGSSWIKLLGSQTGLVDTIKVAQMHLERWASGTRISVDYNPTDNNTGSSSDLTASRLTFSLTGIVNAIKIDNVSVDNFASGTVQFWER